ncbi:MAG: hypothetical protein JXB88_09450 [Spirochaetales bacterium]|nr:hypothetical protein [Spirochaetales bacterium]
MPEIKLQVIPSTKKIAQCQINVDLPLLFGKAFFKRILEEFIGPGNMTADYTWIERLLENGKIRDGVKEKYIEEIMKYFIPADVCPEDIYNKSERIILNPYYIIYQQLYDILYCINNNDLYTIIDMYKRNHAGILAYVSMIKNYVKTAIDAGAVVIFFPEFAFAHLSMEYDDEFMELTRGRIIVAGGIKNVKNNNKAFYYNVMLIYMDKYMQCVNKNVISDKEKKHNIILCQGEDHAVIKPGLFNIMMANCSEFFKNIINISPGIIDKIIKIIQYTHNILDDPVLETMPQLRRMREQNTPITAAAVISYQDISPHTWFDESFRILFEQPLIKLGLYTNTGSLEGNLKWYGQTGLYYMVTDEKYIEQLVHNQEKILKSRDIASIQGKKVYSIYLKETIRYGMLVSSYMDDPEHPYLTDLQVYLPGESEFGELIPRFNI